MLIDGLIKFCNEKSKNIKLKAEPQVFVEIANKLEELKAIKSDGFTDHLLNMGYSKGYNKAIDEFAERMKQLYPTDGHINVTIHRAIKNVAEQLKAGGKNE